MKSYILAIFGFLISWPITLSESTTFDQTYDESIDDLTEESEYDSSSSSIEDADLSYDWPDEDCCTQWKIRYRLTRTLGGWFLRTIF